MQILNVTVLQNNRLSLELKSQRKNDKGGFLWQIQKKWQTKEKLDRWR